MRLRRLIHQESNSCIICALDHGMTSPRFLSGLSEMTVIVREVLAGGANALMLSRSIAEQVITEFRRDTSLALMLSGSAAGRPSGALVTPTSSVKTALRSGADAVVVYNALAGEDEPNMISYLSQVGDSCEAMGMPLIAEAEYPNAYQELDRFQTEYGPEYLLRNARLCVELGADIVKVNWPGSMKELERIVQACRVPIVVAGGVVVDEWELLSRFEQSRKVGAVGCSVGRNIFQHRYPQAMTGAICRVLRDGWSAKEAYQELKELSLLAESDHRHS